MGRGRTIANMRRLDEILRETVSSNDFGTLIDWWNITETIPDPILEEQVPDGRHYPDEASLMFFNLWLNAILDEHPELTSTQTVGV